MTRIESSTTSVDAKPGADMQMTELSCSSLTMETERVSLEPRLNARSPAETTRMILLTPISAICSSSSSWDATSLSSRGRNAGGETWFE